MNEVTEWVVVYWTPTRKERRFPTSKEALRWSLILPSHAKVFIDEVFVGEAVHVR